MSTKDDENARRAQKKCHDIDVKEINHCPVTQDRFLSNEKNMSQFIVLVSEYLRNDHREVINCEGEADTTIVETAISKAATSPNSVVVVADDTDIAVMLMYHWKYSITDVIFYLERSQQGWSMELVTPTVAEIKEHLLFIHVWTGCDTVSGPIWQRKNKFSPAVYHV